MRVAPKLPPSIAMVPPGVDCRVRVWVPGCGVGVGEGIGGGAGDGTAGGAGDGTAGGAGGTGDGEGIGDGEGTGDGIQFAVTVTT